MGGVSRLETLVAAPEDVVAPSSKRWTKFFFCGNVMKHSRHSDNNKPTNGSQSSSQPGVSEVIHDLMRWWDLTISPPRGPHVQQGRAAEQAKMVPHLSRHVCSTLRRRMLGSHFALALASNRTKVFTSHDHRPPTSPARTTRRALARGPTSSG